MNGRKALIALVAALALVLAPSGAAIAGDGATATSSAKSKKKGKARGCKAKGKKGGKQKGKRGKASTSAKKKSRGCKKGGKGGGGLADGSYEDGAAELTLKVTGRGSRIQLERITVPDNCIPLQFGSDESVPLKTRAGSAVAEQTFTLEGGSIITLRWSVEIDPERLRYQLNYTMDYEIPDPDAPTRCKASDRLSGTLVR